MVHKINYLSLKRYFPFAKNNFWLKSYHILLHYSPLSDCRGSQLMNIQFFLWLQSITSPVPPPICDDFDKIQSPWLLSSPNLTESRWKKKYFVLVEGFQQFFLVQAGFQSQFYLSYLRNFLSRVSKDYTTSWNLEINLGKIGLSI